ncbi:MAG: nucleoside hydrolase [Beutenbergiaceae bacterium]
MPTPIIIDTDPGIDDALAIMLAAESPEVQILAITAVAGNTGLDYTAPNSAKLADLLALDCPVGTGATAPLWRRDTAPAQDVHGIDGFGGYQLPDSTRELVPAIELMRDLVESHPNPVTIVAIGPLTNVALFMASYPETARKLARVVLMGGGMGIDLGNTTAAAEFNIYYDPDAAAKVFAFGVPITMVGLNATHQATVGRAHLVELLQSGGPAAQMVDAMLSFYGEGNLSGNDIDDAVAQHDSLAVAAVIDPSLVRTENWYVDVENVGRLTAGMTVVDNRGRSGLAPNADVAVDVDLPGFRSLLGQRLANLDRRLVS